ncbi:MULTISPECIES: hypothetical protein [Brevibacillus]|uniref:hypothetical protein n=1 Tax=Brevibacillus TaxID=55080 RepID=UPI0007D8BC58|nr:MULTISPECIES: hypothetical protein [Brevibacillus]NRR05442.1 hypothetical protein [Brevibacillus sp. RS1.1]
MKKVILLFSIAGIISLGGYGLYVNSDESYAMAHGQLAQVYTSLGELSQDTPLVVEAEVTGKGDKFEYKDVVFVKTDVKIKSVYRENLGIKENDTITVLQTYMEEDPVVEKKENLVLFLDKYTGPVHDDAFTIVGAMQGHFVIKDDKIFPKKEGESNSHNHVNSIGSKENTDLLEIASSGISLDELKKTLDENDYEEPRSLRNAKTDDINEENRVEQELMREIDESGKLKE